MKKAILLSIITFTTFNSFAQDAITQSYNQALIAINSDPDLSASEKQMFSSQINSTVNPQGQFESQQASVLKQIQQQTSALEKFQNNASKENEEKLKTTQAQPEIKSKRLNQDVKFLDKDFEKEFLKEDLTTEDFLKLMALRKENMKTIEFYENYKK